MRILLVSAIALLPAAWLNAGPRPPMPAYAPRAVLVVHGGAGVLTQQEMAAEKLDDGTPLTREHFESALADALEAGYAAWKRSPLDAVEAAVRSMEDCELFNAGKGAALTSDGQAELDAAFMDGDMSPAKKGNSKSDGRKRAGAVTGVTHVKNPISAARAVMEMPGSRHVLSPKCVGVYRGYVTERGEVYVAIYRDEPFVRLTRGKGGKWGKS